jgi:hypothetical protein
VSDPLRGTSALGYQVTGSRVAIAPCFRCSRARALPLSATADPQAVVSVKRCGNAGGPSVFGTAFDVTARNMSCSFARKVARDFMNRLLDTGKIPKAASARGYRFKCSTKRMGIELWNSACSVQVGTKRAKTTFEWGA